MGLKTANKDTNAVIVLTFFKTIEDKQKQPIFGTALRTGNKHIEK